MDDNVRTFSVRLRNDAATFAQKNSAAVSIAFRARRAVSRSLSSSPSMADRKLSGLGAAVQAFSELAYVLMPPRLGTTTGNPDAIASSARDAGGLIVIWMDECVGIGKNASEFFWTFDVAEERCTARKMRCAEYLPAWALNSVARNEQPVIPPCVPGKSGENVEQHGPAIMGYIAYHGMDLSAGITHRFHGLGGLCRGAQVIVSIPYLRAPIPRGRA